jgi:murein DD-endopeptidase MepM/ murein hydrolase activator NlpD
VARSTILIVSSGQTRSLDINTWWLYWLRPVLIGLAFSTVALGAALWVVGAHYVKEHRQNTQQLSQLNEEVTDLRNFTSAEINAKLAALRKSEQAVNEVANYLQARGVNVKPVVIEPPKGMPNPAAGGVSSPLRISHPIPYTGSFADDTESLLQALQGTPLGVPHHGPISSSFGMRPNPFTGQGKEMHWGTDFKGDTGDPVHCTANGKVIFAGIENGYGNVVEVAHEHGYTTVYAHLSRINVKRGQRVRAGDMLGAIGSTGRSTGPHLHYEVHHDDKRLNPVTFLSLSAPAPDLN